MSGKEAAAGGGGGFLSLKVSDLRTPTHAILDTFTASPLSQLLPEHSDPG